LSRSRSTQAQTVADQRRPPAPKIAEYPFLSASSGFDVDVDFDLDFDFDLDLDLGL
jgi:hypothetical protein